LDKATRSKTCMTGTQLIIPLEDDTDNSAGSTNSSRSSHCMNQDTAVAAPSFDLKENTIENNKTLSSSSRVLSDELREQFESMKTVWRHAKRASSGESFVQDGLLSSQELKRKERKTAVETALAVEKEISRWKNGIAELEAMLAAEEDCSLDDYSSDDDKAGAQDGQPGGNQGQRASMNHDHRLADNVGPHPHLGFPCLPLVVPNETDDHDDTSSGPT
jgi:hypothetical protein